MNESDDLNLYANAIRESTCPACGYHVAVPFFDGGQQPLATIACPTDTESAQSLPRLPLDFVRCIDCGHVYNARFDYTMIPYSAKPNLMFNQGAIWSGFIRGLHKRIVEQLPSDPTVVEIGHGDGRFLAALAELAKTGRFMGFDPHGATTDYGTVMLRAQLFEPAHHIKELRPDLIISRHVLEHLVNPLGFLQQISFAATCRGIRPLAYFEVPCIDRVLASGRTVDFYYEHSSQFTTESFTRMLSRCAADVIEIGHGYDGEVVYGFVRLGDGGNQVANARSAHEYIQAARRSDLAIRAQLAEMCDQRKRVAIWGGTGKAAAFMQRYGVDAVRFPVVVDDDVNKVDTFVPGTGQRIRFRDWLLENPVNIVIIPPQWRAADIMDVMHRSGIEVEAVLIEHNGRLIDFRKENHPYRGSSS